MLEVINNDLTNALKSGDKFKLSVLRMLKSEIHNNEIIKKESLTDNDIIQIIKKQVKIRVDSKDDYISYNRLDLADNLSKEINILSIYLPELLSDDKLNSIIDDYIKELDNPSIKSMGIIIKQVGDNYGTCVDMKIVSNLVKEKLSNL